MVTIMGEVVRVMVVIIQRGERKRKRKRNHDVNGNDPLPLVVNKIRKCTNALFCKCLLPLFTSFKVPLKHEKMKK
jgi:hypothetical protein